MANDIPDIPEGCEKYWILNIINPGEYWIVKDQSTNSRKKKMQQINHLLSKNVEKISSAKAVSIGKIFAVKTETEFHRGLVTDIFKKNSTITYLVLLIDYGTKIEVNEKKLYQIKNQDLVHKKSLGIKVSISNIQPVAVDLECEKYLLDGIFCKRVHDNWSVSAYKYVHHLFSKNPWIYVKPVEITNLSISGEIYFLKEPDKVPVSLGQALCEDGFAIVFDTKSGNSVKTSFSGGEHFCIEKKIPHTVFSLGSHSKCVNQSYTNETQCTTKSQSTNPPTDSNSQSEVKVFDKTSYSSRKKIEIEHCNSNLSCQTYSNIYSSSWILKKHFPISLLKSSCNSFENFENNN